MLVAPAASGGLCPWTQAQVRQRRPSRRQRAEVGAETGAGDQRGSQPLARWRAAGTICARHIPTLGAERHRTGRDVPGFRTGGVVCQSFTEWLVGISGITDRLPDSQTGCHEYSPRSDRLSRRHGESARQILEVPCIFKGFRCPRCSPPGRWSAQGTGGMTACLSTDCPDGSADPPLEAGRYERLQRPPRL
jgi:hypothetical protein